MKTFIKVLLLLAMSFCLYSCAENYELNEYYVTYRVYYTSTNIKTETYRGNLPGKRGYDLHLTSNKGTNFISINTHNSISVYKIVISTTAPVEIIDYSNNFRRVYGVANKLQ